MKKTLFNTILYLILTLFTYLSLVIIDILLPRLPKILSKDYKNSLTIIKERQILDFELYKGEKYKNIDQMIYPFDYNYFPLNQIAKKNKFINISSISNNKFIYCSEGYGPKIINTDRFGFRNPDHLWDEEINSVIIGDSFVEGMCVNYQDTLSGIFNKNQIKTISLANGGNSAIYYASLAKIYLNQIKPKNVFLMFHDNDNSLVDSTEPIFEFYNSLNREDYIKKINDKYIKGDKHKNFNLEIVNYLGDLNSKKKNIIFKMRINLSKLKKYLYLTHLREYYHFIFKSDQLFDSAKFAIDEVVEYCKINDCKVHIALMRSSNFWDPRYFYQNFKFSLNKYLNNLNYELISFDDYIDYKNKENYAPKGPHYSIKGYEIIANKLIEKLKLHANK